MSAATRLRRLRCERGEISIIELLVGATVMLLVVGAALTAFEVYGRVDREIVHRNESQDAARTSLDRLARQLRNLASPTPEQPQAIDKATGYDVVFQTVDPNGPNAGTNTSNVKRVRWCLNQAERRLYLQTQTWTQATPPPLPATTQCPSTGWDGNGVVVAHDVVNREGGQERPVFQFDAASPIDISSVHAELIVDREAGKGAQETRLSTGVFLRNQNRRPVAAFSASRSAQGLVLNGSLSADPEGQELEYRWYDGAQQVGTGVVFTYAVASGTSHSITLRVTDPAGLEGASAAQVLTG